MAYRAAHNVREAHARPSLTRPKQTQINRTQTVAWARPWIQNSFH